LPANLWGKLHEIPVAANKSHDLEPISVDQQPEQKNIFQIL
jgi:hypothetical protein